MAVTIIKSASSDNQALVDSTGHLYVTTGGGGGPGFDINLISVGGAPIVLGQNLMINSLPVVIASDQTPIPISGSTTVSGTVSTNVDGLNDFQTSQYTVGTSVVQITPTPLTNRSSISIRVIATGTDIVYIGNSAGVTTSTGYPLYNGDTIQMDLTPGKTIYAIASAPGQTVCALEIA